VLLELRVGEVSGFDLSAMNTYWWHPGAERLDLSRMPHRRLSAPFPLHTLDLQARLASCQRQCQDQDSSGSSSSSSADTHGDRAAATAVWEYDATLEVPVTASGRWNAVAFWFQVHSGAAGANAVVGSWGGGDLSRSSADQPPEDTLAARGVMEVSAEAPLVAASWDPAVQYIDSQEVTAGSAVKLHVRQDTGQYVFTTQPPQCRPRHALGEQLLCFVCAAAYIGDACCSFPH
jgi:hypothetical protein